MFLDGINKALSGAIDEKVNFFCNYLQKLPLNLRLLALYIVSCIWHAKENYHHSIGLCEATLSFVSPGFPIPYIYLNLLLSMNYLSLKDIKNGEMYFDKVWEIAQKDEFYRPIGESFSISRGLLLKKSLNIQSPEYKKISSIAEEHNNHCRKILMTDSYEGIFANLSSTEWSIAKLASKKWTNREIADYLGISVSGVKNYLSRIYQKLYISNRNELKNQL